LTPDLHATIRARAPLRLGLAGGEIQLTDALADLIGIMPFHGYRFEGRRFDCGDKVGFLEANIAFALERPDMGDQVREILSSYRG